MPFVLAKTAGQIGLDPNAGCQPEKAKRGSWNAATGQLGFKAGLVADFLFVDWPEDGMNANVDRVDAPGILIKNRTNRPLMVSVFVAFSIFTGIKNLSDLFPIQHNRVISSYWFSNKAPLLRFNGH